MSQRYLEVTYRNGRPIAGYFYLPRNSGDFSSRSDRRESGLIVDYAEDGRPIGIEITAPSSVTLASLNEVLKELAQEPVVRSELEPILAA